MHHPRSTVSVTATHQRYICPEGATVQMICHQSGAAAHPTDGLRHNWLFTPHSDQHCSGHVGPRNFKFASHNHTLPKGVRFGHAEQNFWVVLENVTHADQGRYCCMLGVQHVEPHHDNIVQKIHSYSILQIIPRKDSKCMGVFLRRTRSVLFTFLQFA